jgi:prepilin-type N-terminal cleavage/methylation domain-containing protein
MKKMKINNKGFSLLELLLVVAVGAVLLLSGLAVYQNVTNNTKINDGTRLLNVLKQETQRLFQGEGVYTAQNLTPILINADVVPSSNVRGTEISHPFNGTVTVTGATGTFTIQYAGIPKAACVKLGQLYSLSDPDFDNLTIGTTEVEAGDDGVIGVIDLDGSCDATNDMIWTFF